MQGRFSAAPTLFPLILAGLLAGMTYWLDVTSRQPVGAGDGKSRHDPDYIVENFQVRRFGPEGQLQHTLYAGLMRHYPDDDSTVVFAPDLIYHRTPPTHVTAREARLSSEATHIELIDAVRITRGGVAGKPDTVLTTSRLDAWPDDEIATGKEPVTITQGRTIVHGSGLQANNKTAIYVLEGPVRGIFHRNQTTVTSAVALPEPVTQPAVQPEPTLKPKPKSKPRSKPRPKPQPKR
jgi:lipopolysaccharide export system protein LptC